MRSRGATAAAFVAMLVACSGTPTVLQFVAADDAGDGTNGVVSDAGADTQTPKGVDAADAGDPMVDSGPDVYVAGGCGLDTSATSESCGIGRSCTTSSCARGRFYGCFDGKRPPIPGCARLDGQEHGDFCCTPACVRSANSDVECGADSGERKWVCPLEADGGYSSPPPSESCRVLAENASHTTRIICCP